MATVTDITPQKRNPNLYNIYLDDKFSFSLSDLDISLANIKIGDEFSKEEVEQFLRQSKTAKAYAMALRLLARRRRSQGEMRVYLRRKLVDEEISQIVIDRLLRERLLDDQAFAEAWISDRNLIKPRSTKMLALELRKKQIDRDVVEEVLSKQSEEDEVKNACLLIEKKIKNPRFTDQQKLIEYLSRQGFSYTVVKKAFQLIGL